MSVKGKPKLCKNGCNLTIVWYHDDATRQEYLTEMDTNGQATKRHKCLNWRPSSQKTPTPTPTSTSSQLDRIEKALTWFEFKLDDNQHGP